MPFRIDESYDVCGRTLRAATNSGGACSAGKGWSLSVRHRGNPQGQFARRATQDRWSILRVPLGYPAAAWDSLNLVASHPVRGQAPTIPRTAARRYYSGTSFELHLELAGMRDYLPYECVRIGVSLLGLAVNLRYVPASVPEDDRFDLSQDEKVIDAIFGKDEPDVAEGWLRWNLDSPAMPAELPQPDLRVGAELKPPISLLQSSFLPQLEARVGTGYCHPYAGLNADGFPEAEARLRLKDRPEKREASRSAIALGLGCDLWFLTDARGLVLNPGDGRYARFEVSSRSNRAPYKWYRVPLMWYNVRYQAEFYLRAFALDHRGFGCETPIFGVRVETPVDWTLDPAPRVRTPTPLVGRVSTVIGSQPVPASALESRRGSYGNEFRLAPFDRAYLAEPTSLAARCAVDAPEGALLADDATCRRLRQDPAHPGTSKSFLTWWVTCPLPGPDIDRTVEREEVACVVRDLKRIAAWAIHHTQGEMARYAKSFTVYAALSAERDELQDLIPQQAKEIEEFRGRRPWAIGPLGAGPTSEQLQHDARVRAAREQLDAWKLRLKEVLRRLADIEPYVAKRKDALRLSGQKLEILHSQLDGLDSLWVYHRNTPKVFRKEVCFRLEFLRSLLSSIEDVKRTFESAERLERLVLEAPPEAESGVLEWVRAAIHFIPIFGDAVQLVEALAGRSMFFRPLTKEEQVELLLGVLAIGAAEALAKPFAEAVKRVVGKVRRRPLRAVAGAVPEDPVIRAVARESESAVPPARLPDAPSKGAAKSKRSAGGRTLRHSDIDWSEYPSSAPRPKGPFRILEGAEYTAARDAADKANRALRAANPAKYAGKQIHEIHTVKFGGSPTDPANKIALSPAEHYRLNAFWLRIQRSGQ